MPWLMVNQTRLSARAAVPTALLALDVQRGGMPGDPLGAVKSFNRHHPFYGSRRSPKSTNTAFHDPITIRSIDAISERNSDIVHITMNRFLLFWAH
jgi:hypothetical protein